MQKEEKERTKSKRNWLKILFIAAAVLFVAVYLCVQIYNSRKKESLITEIALADSVVKELTVDLFVVRDEQVITANTSAYIASAVKDGARIGAGETVAYSFADSESAGNLIRMKEISEQLDYYNSLLGKSASVTGDTTQYDNRIQGDVCSLASCIAAGNFSSLSDIKNELRDAVTSRQTATGIELDLSETILSLQSEYASLQQATSKYTEITADSSGYYISGTDGYEKTLHYADADSWTVEEVQSALEAEPAAGSASEIGRIVHEYYWYLVCVADTSQISGLSEGSRKTIAFPDSDVPDITAQIYAIRSDRESGKSLVIFSCDQMSEELASLRRESAAIVLEEIEGYRVSNSAICVNEENEKGVYVVNGSVMSFRKINIVYSAETYSIVTNPYLNDVSSRKNTYLNLYDKYIVSGKDLADEKNIG